VINKAKYDSLSPEDQKILKDEADKVPGFSIGVLTKPSTLVTQLCDEGVPYYAATPADLQALASATQPVYAQYTKDPQTKRFVDQIKQMKSEAGPPPAAPPPPAKCLAK
jgi:TRAP-type C4-dicarboxylate transport system substrate-binding protein